MQLSWVQQAAVLAMTITLGAGTTGVHAQAKAQPKAAAKAGAPADTAEMDARAEAIYKRTCSVCHAMDGNSPLPNMSFTDGVWRHGTTVKEMTETISNGVPGTAMMPFKTQFTEDEILALARYVRKFDKKLK
jgi:mono/diheme cytochrome c family protein